MDVRVANAGATSIQAGLLVIPCVPNETPAVLASINEAAGIDVLALATEEHFEAKSGQVFMLRGLKGLKTHRILLVGLGEESDRTVDALQAAGATAVRKARKVFIDDVAFIAPQGVVNGTQFITGALLGAYTFDQYITKKETDFQGFKTFTVISEEDISASLDAAQIVATGINLARDLVNDTPNHQTPITLAETGMDIASEFGLEAIILDEEKLTEDGFNLLLAVGRGSDNPSRLIHLIYKPEGEVTRKVAFVGKGITFDTGGYNLKPSSGLLHMHSDMAGAAAVLGAARAIAELKPAGIEVHFVCPSAENSVNGDAMRPQDIIRGLGGKTVEIQNTDAEGRLILADALAYTQQQDVDTIVDLATLTGACVVALGEGTAALFSDDEELAAGLLGAAKATGEDFWRMPLNKKLDSLLDTPTADMKNIGSRWGGAITAALFLKRWVDIDSWAHLDIAGPAYSDKESALAPPGGTGFAVATLVQYIMSLSKG